MESVTAAKYSVERQRAEGAEWSLVSSCNSMIYARIVAGAGLRRHIGVSYRLIDKRSGAITTLFPAMQQKAA